MGLFDSVTDTVNNAANTVSNTANDVANTVSNTANDAADTFSSTANDVADTSFPSPNEISDTVSDTANNAADTVSDTADNVTDNNLSPSEIVANKIPNTSAEELNNAADTVSDTAEDVADTVSDTGEDVAEQASNAADTVSDAAEDVADTVSDSAENATDTVSDIAEDVAETGEDVAEQASDGSSGTSAGTTTAGFGAPFVDLAEAFVDNVGDQFNGNNEAIQDSRKELEQNDLLGKLLTTADVGLEAVADPTIQEVTEEFGAGQAIADFWQSVADAEQGVEEFLAKEGGDIKVPGTNKDLIGDVGDGTAEFVAEALVLDPARELITLGTGIDPVTGKEDAAEIEGAIDGVLTLTGVGKAATTTGKALAKGYEATKLGNQADEITAKASDARKLTDEDLVSSSKNQINEFDDPIKEKTRLDKIIKETQKTIDEGGGSKNTVSLGRKNSIKDSIKQVEQAADNISPIKSATTELPVVNEISSIKKLLQSNNFDEAATQANKALNKIPDKTKLSDEGRQLQKNLENLEDFATKQSSQLKNQDIANLFQSSSSAGSKFIKEQTGGNLSDEGTKLKNTVENLGDFAKKQINQSSNDSNSSSEKEPNQAEQAVDNVTNTDNQVAGDNNTDSITNPNQNSTGNTSEDSINNSVEGEQVTNSENSTEQILENASEEILKSELGNLDSELPLPNDIISDSVKPEALSSLEANNPVDNIL